MIEDEEPKLFSQPSPASFDFDDAFSDGDEADAVQYAFSPDAARADMASLSIDSEWSNTNTFQEPELENSSVSTMALNHSHSQSSIASSTRSHIFDERFSQISLSEDLQAEESVDTVDHDEHVDEPTESTHVPPAFFIQPPPSPPSPSTPVESDTIPSSPLVFAHNESADDLSSASSMPMSEQSIPSPAEPVARSTSASASTSKFNSNVHAPSRHRPTRSVGPSAFEKVMSKTRPSFLPPKERWEDRKHMSDWETMMRQSRAAADKRAKALHERRQARERQVEDMLPVWEKEIVPDWRVVTKNPALRRLWWTGIPTKLRATMWEQAVGNPLALSKDSYRTCLARAKRALAAGTFPTTTLGLLEEDIDRTLPALHIFNRENGPLYADLKDMICAWVVSRSDEGLGYVTGVSKIAAMLLINMTAQRGFIVMRNLLERHCMRSFYGGMGTHEDVEAYYRIFDTLLADGMPKIYFNFKQHQISPSSYLLDWMTPLFLDHLPFEACTRIWDVLLLEGDSFLYRASLGVLAVLEPRLFFPDQRELLELLKGENKAALDVAKREGRPLDGGRYEIYGVDEETLWERIDSMQDWWKESTWTRLIQRELPDL